MPILLSKIIHKGGGGQKCLNFCLRRKSMAPKKNIVQGQIVLDNLYTAFFYGFPVTKIPILHDETSCTLDFGFPK